MKRLQTVPCPRYVRTAETCACESEWEPLPRSMSARERDAQTKDVYLSYEPCPGDVRVLPDGKFGECPECRGGDWTTAEAQTMHDSLPEAVC